MNISLERAIDLPWTDNLEENSRFQIILTIVMAITLVLAIVVPNLPVEKPDRKKAEEIPPRFAKLILEKETPPPPPPPKIEEKKPEKKPEKKKPQPEKKVVKKKPPVQVDPDRARKVAEQSGLLAMQDELADLRTNVSDEALQNRNLQKGGNEANTTTRSIITSNATTGSGGINTSKLSRDTGGSNLAGRSVTQVDSKLKADTTKVKRSGNSRKASRSIEELQLVFDKNKGAIYSIYNRALRKDPTLQGKVVLKLTILPSGKVSQCTVVSSELNNPELERKLTSRVKLFQFGAREVDTMITTYPIVFLPS